MDFGHLFLSISGNLKIVLKNVVKISLLHHNALKYCFFIKLLL
jgi:hypothetical protein